MASPPTFPWPPLGRPAGPLELQQLAEGLFVVDDVLSSSQCQAICDAARELVLPTNPRNLPPPKGEAFRNNERLLINDETFATTFFDHIRGPLSCVVREDGATPVALNPAFRIYKYSAGQRFGPHVDEPVRSSDGSMESEFTLLLYLNGGPHSWGGPLKGGETRFHVSKKGQPVDVAPQMGRLLLHWTGHAFLHEGCQVNGGEKWLLRTDVFFPRAVPMRVKKSQERERGGAGGKSAAAGGAGKKKSR